VNQPEKFTLAYLALLALGWVILRVAARRDYLSRGKLSLQVSILQALLFFIYGGFPYLYLPPDWPSVHVDLIYHIVGIGLIIVGLAFLFYGMLRLGLLPSMGLGRQELEYSGIYASSRNPQALACGLYVLGFAMLWPCWYAFFWAILYAVLIHLMIVTEEEYLNQIYGARYAEYCQTVPRYFRVMPKSRKDSP
jgi:protein-S-isoprenylcysteine O-methyltransferase Ste14